MIRFTNDINKIVVHHTGTSLISSGEEHNRDHAMREEFGSPFDILINPDGKIDLSPQWIYAIESAQYEKDVHFSRLFISTSHHPARIGKTVEEKNKMVHIAVVGDFNIRGASPYQVNGVLKTLEFLCRGLQLCAKQSIYYYSEFYLDSSPGIYFPAKEFLINSLMEKKILQNLC